ncbi:SDR family oxidoreductase [Labrys sp. LIt4]|uniref:SDR family NAD(P)-dependent oxidoreductase n=1 Tax=Labrys sp. LIt4 TaxID=2821355 RepID=UPI001ADFA2D9|nr:SDR family oxidoreductase [Labrys sp. LIt4]MBP0580519.1 SDR family oxidoreductase [Labrys sp. LIt4]
MVETTPGNLDGRKIVVIGGGQLGRPEPASNGRAISLTLARRGAHLMVADRSEEAARFSVDAIRSEGGIADMVKLDIADPDAVRRCFNEFDAEGPIDGLVLNVGISDRRRLEDITPQSWDAILNVNLRGHMLCAQVGLETMKPGSAIVFISSLCAHLPLARNPAYEASKAGIGALCRAVAMSGHERAIRANCVVAGFVDTPMGLAASTARPERASRPLPFGRMASAWEIAEAVAFLISNQSSYVNATELLVDGGLAAGITLPVQAEENDHAPH